MRKAPERDCPLLSPPAHIHILGVGGVGMSALAGLLVEKGYRVSGSDNCVHPPVSDLLRDLGISPLEGHSPSNLIPRPDLAVVGNVIRRDNPEAQALIAQSIPFTSLPAMLTAYFTETGTRIVVAGTHGKTTTAAMIAHVLTDAGLDPGYFIGGLPSDSKRSFRLGHGNCFVIEGDEYDTAYFEKTPKFLHYRPNIGIITSVEFDHGDIYRDLDHVKSAFGLFARSIPPDGALVAYGDHMNVRDAITRASADIHLYGESKDCGWKVAEVKDTGSRTRASLYRDGAVPAIMELAQTGRHNILNAIAATAACALVGVPLAHAVEALGRFRGVRRRQEMVGEAAGITVLDDFAHHPTAVRETLKGLRGRFPSRRLVAVFEPRTNTSVGSVFQNDYVHAFLEADVTVAREPKAKESYGKEARLSANDIAKALIRRGRKAYAFSGSDEILAFLSGALQSGDVVLIMSTGAFDDLPHRLHVMLRRRDT